MKPNNVIIFLGRRYELCKAFGLFGKENLIFQSEFDHKIYTNSKYVKYYFEELKSDVIFLAGNTLIDDLDIDNYSNIIIMVSEDDVYKNKHIYYRKKYPNCKLVFLWMYGEVFSKKMFESVKSCKLDLILSGSYKNMISQNLISVDYIENINDIGIFDAKLCFKFFYYYIGYYYLDTLYPKIGQTEYDNSKLPIFTYSKATNESSWRNDVLNSLHQKFPNKIFNGSSINDSYDLEFTKYKHFETMYDYSYRNYNLIFETIDYRNNGEYFATEKTFKALFFGNPSFLVAPTDLISELSKEFYLLNSEFESVDDFVGSSTLESDFAYFKEKSKLNHKKIMDYIHDYSYTNYFKQLLNQ